MILQEIFDQLTYGELAQVSLGGGDEDIVGVTAVNYPIIISHINLGLADLHKRFTLRTERITIPQVTGTEDYTLANTNVLKIEKVQTMQDVAGYFGVTSEWVDLTINDDSDDTGVDVEIYNTIKVPDAVTGVDMQVIYRAAHPLIDPTLVDPTIVNVDIGYSHLGALLLFVAARVHNNLPALNGVNTGNEYMVKYEQECIRIQVQGFVVENKITSEKLEINDWV